jgi:hypothetical protein
VAQSVGLEFKPQYVKKKKKKKKKKTSRKTFIEALFPVAKKRKSNLSQQKK